MTLLGRAVGEHLVAVALLGKPARDHLTKYATTFDAAFAGHHQNAAKPAGTGHGQELIEGIVGFGLGSAVQIQAPLDLDLPALQSLPAASIDVDGPGMVELKRLAGRPFRR